MESNPKLGCWNARRCWPRPCWPAARVWPAQELNAPAAQSQGSSIVKRIGGAADRLEMTINTSRLLTLDKKIPKALVDNPEIVELHPRAANVLMVAARHTGATQITLWDEDGKIYTIDVMVVGDAKELEHVLKSQFPTSQLKVFPTANSVIISGHVEDPAYVNRVYEIAQDYYPKVISNITVGGVQQVLLRVKVMEVSRTKLRALGFDWGHSGAGGNFAVQSVSGLLSRTSATTGIAGSATSAGTTMVFGLVNGGSTFNSALEALEKNNVLKLLAEPNLMTVSGRPAFFNSGGEFPILTPQSLGTVSVQFKKYGTQVDFVPIVLANGNIRLEVRPRVSEVDTARSVSLQGFTIPALRMREVDTGVEMQAGQTLALAGLVQTRIETETKGIPWLKDLPYLGVPFRRVSDTENEVELLIMVTPELVAPLNCLEVPPGGPGLRTQSPRDKELYCKGYTEVPRCCLDGSCDACQALGAGRGIQFESQTFGMEQGIEEVSPSMVNPGARPLPGGPGGETPGLQDARRRRRRRATPRCGVIRSATICRRAAPSRRRPIRTAGITRSGRSKPGLPRRGNPTRLHRTDGL